MAWTSMQSSQSELWDYVSPFETYEYIRRIYSELHCLSESNEDKIRQIAAAFGQGRMYFASAEPAPLGVKPVLLYYGASALLTGLALIRNTKLTQQNWPAGHGLTCVGWRGILYDDNGDVLQLAIKATRKGTFQHIVDTVWQGHIETVLYGRRVPHETAPYVHRLGAIQFAEDQSPLTFADLASRSRYTGGYYGSITGRRRSLQRATVWMDPRGGPSGLHVTLPPERQRNCWLVDDAKRAGLQLLGPADSPSGAIFPRRDYTPACEPDFLPVFHYERTEQMSICESMPNGDKPNELLKLYLMAYVAGMFARYYPSQWLAVIRGTSSAPDTAMFVSAVTAIERNFVREFSAQLAVLGDDPHFFSEHFGYEARMTAPDWRCYIGGTGSGEPVVGTSLPL